MANSASSKKRNRRAVMFLCAVIGALTIAVNVWTLGSELSRSVVHTVKHHSWIPTLVSK
jgi:hypothetical protein